MNARYVLASLDPGRAQVQILHEWDSCCFAAGGLHNSLLDYNRAVAKLLNSSDHNITSRDAAATGYFRTVVTSGNYHQVNVRDKVVVAVVVEWLRRWDQPRVNQFFATLCSSSWLNLYLKLLFLLLVRRFGSVTSETFSGGTFAPFDLLLQNGDKKAE